MNVAPYEAVSSANRTRPSRWLNRRAATIATTGSSAVPQSRACVVLLHQSWPGPRPVCLAPLAPSPSYCESPRNGVENTALGGSRLLPPPCGQVHLALSPGWHGPRHNRVEAAKLDGNLRRLHRAVLSLEVRWPSCYGLPPWRDRSTTLVCIE